MLEFALLAPLIVGMLLILIDVEKAISTAIVNQKYARAHVHFLSFNHRHYPDGYSFRTVTPNGRYMSRWWIGVDDNITAEDVGKTPKAPTRKIGVRKPPEDSQAGEVSERQNVRIRVAVFSCIPPLGIKKGQIFSEGYIEEKTYEGGSFKHCEM